MFRDYNGRLMLEEEDCERIATYFDIDPTEVNATTAEAYEEAIEYEEAERKKG